MMKDLGGQASGSSGDTQLNNILCKYAVRMIRIMSERAPPSQVCFCIPLAMPVVDVLAVANTLHGAVNPACKEDGTVDDCFDFDAFDKQECSTFGAYAATTAIGAMGDDMPQSFVDPRAGDRLFFSVQAPLPGNLKTVQHALKVDLDCLAAYVHRLATFTRSKKSMGSASILVPQTEAEIEERIVLYNASTFTKGELERCSVFDIDSKITCEFPITLPGELKATLPKVVEALLPTHACDAVEKGLVYRLTQQADPDSIQKRLLDILKEGNYVQCVLEPADGAWSDWRLTPYGAKSMIQARSLKNLKRFWQAPKNKPIVELEMFELLVSLSDRGFMGKPRDQHARTPYIVGNERILVL